MRNFLAVGICSLLFLNIVKSSYAQPTWSIDTLVPMINLTMYCIPNIPGPSIAITPGGECLGRNVNYNFVQTDQEPGDSGIHQYTPFNSSNCQISPTQTINPVVPTLIQNCTFDKFTSENFVVNIMDRTGNLANRSVSESTPGFIYGWYKMNGTNFHSLGGITHRIPESPTPFDASDTNEPYLIVGTSNNNRMNGVVSANNNISLQGPTAQVSNKQWRRQTYTLTREHTNVSTFIDRLKLLHDHTEIFSLSEVQSNGLFYIKTNQTISNANIFVGKENFVVLFEDANLTLHTNLNSTASQSFALITNRDLRIRSTVTSLGGIYMGQNVDITYDITDLNAPSGNELKINGNLISYTSIANLKRERNDLSIPSFYIQYNQKMYFDLLDYISLLNQDGWQLQ